MLSTSDGNVSTKTTATSSESSVASAGGDQQISAVTPGTPLDATSVPIANNVADHTTETSNNATVVVSAVDTTALEPSVPPISTTAVYLLNPLSIQNFEGNYPQAVTYSTNTVQHVPLPSNAASPASNQQQNLQGHQNVRDMDIVHVQWLIENYETAEGVSLPRSTLYTHYQTHCTQQGIEPVNAASFGKLIRSVFIGLRTRRLGTRGNSKYHYYGIRVKPGSVLSRLDNIGGPSTPEPLLSTPAKRIKVSHSTSSNSNATVNSHGPKASHAVVSSVPENHAQQATLTATSPDVLLTHLGDPQSILPSVWPDEPIIPNNSDTDAPGFLAIKFAACYRKHYEEIINCLGTLQFNQVEAIWQKFWQPESKEAKVLNDSKDKLGAPNGISLTIGQLHELTSTASLGEETAVTSLADWIIQTDYTLYNALISSLLLPSLLKPIPQQLTQLIRNFSKNITIWISNALVGYDENFIALKIGAVGAFSHALRRYTSLNHLSSAARAVLQNQQQISQMIADFNRVDFQNVQEQACWVCHCEDEMVDQIEKSFKQLLQQENPFEHWGQWCEQIVETCLTENDVRSATQFFFKWGFYSSLVMRDLTLRSASSFGSFHLIRLLFDEYIFYLIEHRVAKQSGKTPLQVLGEARSLRNQNGLGVPVDAHSN